MSRVRDINWRPSTSERPTSSQNSVDAVDPFKTYLDSLQRLSDEVIINFINDVNSDGHEPALRTILFPEEKRRDSKIKDEVFLSNLYNKNYSNKSRSELVRIGKSIRLEISKEDIAEITRVTLTQRKSKFWIALKRGRITGSNFKDCCVTSVENPSVTTISRVINPMGIKFNRIPSVKYEIKNKKKAINQYRSNAQENHENFQYQTCGLIFNQKIPFFTDSSDGLVCCDCHGVGCLEIKCMNILETESFDKLTQKPNNILNKFGEQYYLEYSHEIFYKIQMNIHLSESKYCDFVLWSSTRTLAPLVLRIKHDVEFWKLFSTKALTFHEEVIMPELLAKFFTKGKGSVLYKIATKLITVFFLESRQSIEDNDGDYFDGIDEDLNDEDLNDEYFQLVDLEIEILNSVDH